MASRGIFLTCFRRRLLLSMHSLYSRFPAGNRRIATHICRTAPSQRIFEASPNPEPAKAVRGLPVQPHVVRAQPSPRSSAPLEERYNGRVERPCNLQLHSRRGPWVPLLSNLHGRYHPMPEVRGGGNALCLDQHPFALSMSLVSVWL